VTNPRRASTTVSSLDAAKKIEFGPYGEWKSPARLYMNVERAYREFRNEPPEVGVHGVSAPGARFLW
jgi:hypothetical protein